MYIQKQLLIVGCHSPGSESSYHVSMTFIIENIFLVHRNNLQIFFCLCFQTQKGNVVIDLFNIWFELNVFDLIWSAITDT